jgi:two-component system, OmpR family, alkaline phosphatase synthesis response regulator PhoP
MDTLSGKKIYWVEDDTFLSGLIVKKFKDSNVVLRHFKSGEDLFSEIARERPDVVVTDILMPAMDGFEILRKLKVNPDTASIPVVLLSNLGQQSEMEQALRLGATKFLVKASLSLDEVVKEISGCFNNIC